MIAALWTRLFDFARALDPVSDLSLFVLAVAAGVVATVFWLVLHAAVWSSAARG